ncbi:MAG: carbohydrate-binding protein [Paenibacillaceae bacterium]|jgi:hypothetical protein|nr:carbohydrate-binding protein [Paenibacillaceae bacterium]
MIKIKEASANIVDGTTGTPLGGFGTGAVKFCAHTGTFAAVTQAPADQYDYTPMGETRLQFYSCRNGQTGALHTLKSEVTDGRSADDAIWPLHRVNFGTVQDITVRMLAFAPFDPSNTELMSLPYAFYELELHNKAGVEAEAACALQLDVNGGPFRFVEGKGLVSHGWSVFAGSSDAEAAVTADALNRVAVKVKLEAYETKTIRFVLAWYDDSDPERHYYLGRYDSSAAIAGLGMEHFETMKRKAVELVERMRGSNLPEWLVNQTLNTLVNLTNNSLYKKDGRVAFAEGEWTCFGTMDQMWHARQIINQLIPFFAWQELQYWARTQKGNGQIHHDFNTAGPDKSVLVAWDDREHADYRNIDKWVDLNCGLIVSVYETYLATGDKEQLDYFWPYLKKAGQRILDQVELYGSEEYPYTFEDSENSYDAGGDPNPFNASLSAVAYRIMLLLGEEKEEDGAFTRTYQTAYETVVSSYRRRYLEQEFPTGRGCESYFAGQWLSLHLRLGEIWSADETDRVLEQLDGYYHPYYWGMGHLGGTYNEWTPYLLTHYGGLLLHTRRADQWLTLQKDAYNRQYSNRDYVFNHPLDILPAAGEPHYLSAEISGDKQYISMPGLWRNYYDIAGLHRDAARREIWLQPIVLEEMGHRMTEALIVMPEGYGTISCSEGGSAGQNRDILLRTEFPLEMKTIHLTDCYGDEVAVTVNGVACPFIRTGTGYARELAVAWEGTIDSTGIRITAVGNPGPAKPPLPERPTTGADGAKPSALRDAYGYMEAESADETAGITLVTPVGGTWYVTDCHNFDYIKLQNVVFGEVGSATFIAKAASSVEGSRMEIVLDSVGGQIIGECAVPHTGGAEQWKTVTCPIARTTGTHHVILKFYGNSQDNLLNLDKFKFLQDDGRLDRTGWAAKTSRNGLNAYTLLDGDPATGWRITYGTEGAYILLDMQEEPRFNGITLQHQAEDEPVQYEVYVSGDGADFGTAAVAAGVGEKENAITRMVFPVQQARYVKVVFTGSGEPRQLTVSEMNVWNYS